LKIKKSKNINKYRKNQRGDPAMENVFIKDESIEKILQNCDSVGINKNIILNFIDEYLEGSDE
jgi:hypothetical protein